MLELPAAGTMEQTGRCVSVLPHRDSGSFDNGHQKLTKDPPALALHCPSYFCCCCSAHCDVAFWRDHSPVPDARPRQLPSLSTSATPHKVHNPLNRLNRHTRQSNFGFWALSSHTPFSPSRSTTFLILPPHSSQPLPTRSLQQHPSYSSTRPEHTGVID